MDAPDLDAAKHALALEGLARLNRWSGSARILWPALRELARGQSEPLRILDVATGAGDVPLALWNKARQAGLRLKIRACDISATALACAEKRARAAGVPAAELEFFEVDALSGVLLGEPDVAICSLFLHHLDSDPATRLLERMRQVSKRAILINDLERGRMGLALAYAATRLLTRSEIVHWDGPASVHAAYTKTEALELARAAGMPDAKVESRWPCRFLLSWRKP